MRQRRRSPLRSASRRLIINPAGMAIAEALELYGVPEQVKSVRRFLLQHLVPISDDARAWAQADRFIAIAKQVAAEPGAMDLAAVVRAKRWLQRVGSSDA